MQRKISTVSRLSLQLSNTYFLETFLCCVEPNIPSSCRPFLNPDTMLFFSMRNEAHEEFRNAYNKVFEIYYLYFRPFNNNVVFPVLEEANRVVGKWSVNLL